MRIAVGSDHAGYELKQALAERLEAEGHDVRDMGAFSADSVDYPDYAAKVARSVAQGEAQRGLLVCGSGVGMSVAANRFHGVRAVLAPTVEHASLGRRHNDANVLCLGQRLTSFEAASEILDAFIQGAFEGGRHDRRVKKIETVSGG